MFKYVIYSAKHPDGTMFFNTILRLQYFTKQWKVTQIIMIQMPGKEDNNRAISLLPILSKSLSYTDFKKSYIGSYLILI